jgi:TPR repeat protein
MSRPLLFALALLLAAPPLARAETGALARVAQLEAAVAAIEAGRPAQARRLLKPLAEDGSALAETLLGGLYARGLGGPRDLPAAVGFWWRAAQRGYAPAQLALAQALATGQGVAASPDHAYRWALLAARSGDDAVRAAAERLRIDLGRRIGAEASGRMGAKADAFRPWSPTE